MFICFVNRIHTLMTVNNYGVLSSLPFRESVRQIRIETDSYEEICTEFLDNGFSHSIHGQNSYNIDPEFCIAIILSLSKQRTGAFIFRRVQSTDVHA